MLQGLIMGMLSALISYFNFRSLLKSCLLSESHGETKTFSYKGKRYDRNLFISAYMSEYSDMKPKDIASVLKSEEAELNSPKRKELAEATVEALNRLQGRWPSESRSIEVGGIGEESKLSGYSTVYAEKTAQAEPVTEAEQEMVSEPVAVLEKEPEELGGETEDGVGLLMRLQAEEEAKRASLEPPAPLERKKGAPVWSVVALGALCVALVVTVGVLGWQWEKVAGERDLLNAQIMKATEQKRKMDDEIAELNDKYWEQLFDEIMLQRQLDFWTENAVVVELFTSTDSSANLYRYHTTDCDNRKNAIEAGRFFIAGKYIADTIDTTKCGLCRLSEIAAGEK